MSFIPVSNEVSGLLTQRPGIALQPIFIPVKDRIVESHDVVTLTFALQNQKPEQPDGSGSLHSANVFKPLASEFKPGQFNMMYAFGVGEVPISISGDSSSSDTLVHTIRGVGPVSDALLQVRPGEQVGLRGPYGRGWPVGEAQGRDVLLIAGGIGLAPLRPVIYHLLRHRSHYGHVAILYGARSPEELIFARQLEQWCAQSDIQMRVTVDRADSLWRGDVGVVTQLIETVNFDPAETLAMICGPDIMFRFTAVALQDKGVSDRHIYFSMERNMKCAIGSCGHCQFGPHFICKDGPVFPMDQIRTLFSLREI